MNEKSEKDSSSLRKQNEGLYKEVAVLRERLQHIIDRDSGKLVVKTSLPTETRQNSSGAQYLKPRN